MIFAQAMELAYAMNAEAVGLDVEGVLCNYYGNDPDPSVADRPVHDNERLAHRYASGRYLGALGLMTNNTNRTIPTADRGLVTQVAKNVGGGFTRMVHPNLIHTIPYVHKDMRMPDGSIMGKKPDGTQGTAMAQILDANPARMVLIDDQGVKNAGEAVKAGFKAIIVPDPIGERKLGRVDEHSVVMALRLIEPWIFTSLARRGRLSQEAYERIAGISIDQIAYFADHRTQ